MGTEKIESELSRVLPQAKIRILDEQRDTGVQEADIFIATKSIIKETDYHFDLIGVLSIDNSLNHVDFRAGEKTFEMLVGLLGLTQKQLIIQTNSPKHHCFQALENKNINMFYDEELKQRKQLNFPPYQHFGIVKLRGKEEPKVRQVSSELFKQLNRYNKNKAIKVISLNPGEPPKLRGNFYRQILLQAKSPALITKFIKINLKNFLHSGIIVTADIDPI
jgi:primosomal protein N' (replication factor Y)